jgi:Na+/H+-dicarboxylate symporter
VSLSKQILVALVAGVAIGLFFGERVAFLVLGWWED